MNRIWHFYDLSTGLFTGQSFSAAREADLARNTPPGCGACEGVRDPYSQRVDLKTGEVVDWQPPEPSPDHEWDAQTKRWQLSAAAAEREARRAQALARIRALEALQHRALREAVLGIAPSEEDRARGAMTLAEIDQEIAALRPLLSEQTAASGNL